MSKVDSTPYKVDSDIDRISLIKLSGKNIKDIYGWIGNPYNNEPVFTCSRVIFDDGTSIYFEGEHDVAYLPNGEFLVDLEDLMEDGEEDIE